MDLDSLMVTSQFEDASHVGWLAVQDFLPQGGINVLVDQNRHQPTFKLSGVNIGDTTSERPQLFDKIHRSLVRAHGRL
jgi:hypothetical protein